MPRGTLLPVRLARVLVLVASMGPVASLRAQQPRQGATISGVVRDAAGVPLPGVQVAVTGSGLRVATDDSGAYRLVGLAPGRATLTARRLGYGAYTEELRLDDGESRHVDLQLTASVSTLTGIDVTAPREPYDARLEGFHARSRRRVGHFVTRERIERANSANVSDLLREIPGVRIGSMRNEGKMIRFRGATCPPLVFIDGVPATVAEFDVDMIDLRTVEGIEVYSGAATVPPEFAGPRDLDRCGVIAIWSRPARPPARSVESAADTVAPPDPATRAEAYTADRVDVVARLDSGSLRPSYPDSLYRAGVAGRVVVEFVVDTSGQVEARSVEVMASTDPLFTLAVRQALGNVRFVPARLGDRRVRQVVQLPVRFSPSAAPAEPGPPAG